MFAFGCFVHAVNPASATDAAAILKKLRRSSPSSHSEAPSGNSRCSISRNCGVSATSSRLRQYCCPLPTRSLARTASRSTRPEQVVRDEFTQVSAMAHAAIAQLLEPAAGNVIGAQQLGAPLRLVRRRLPAHVVDFVGWP